MMVQIAQEMEEVSEVILVVLFEDWLDCIKKWINIFWHPVALRNRITFPCGLCEAMARAGYGNDRIEDCFSCPAFPEMCQNTMGNGLLEEIAKNSHSPRKVKRGAVKMLLWLKEFGAIADWNSKSLENVLKKAKEEELEYQARQEIKRIEKREKSKEQQS